MTINATKNAVCLIRVAVLCGQAAAKDPDNFTKAYRKQLAWNEAAHLIGRIRAAR